MPGSLQVSIVSFVRLKTLISITKKISSLSLLAMRVYLSFSNLARSENLFSKKSLRHDQADNLEGQKIRDRVYLECLLSL